MLRERERETTIASQACCVQTRLKPSHGVFFNCAACHRSRSLSFASLPWVIACPMVSEALLHASTFSSKAFHESLKASEASPCSFHLSRNAKGLCMHQCFISSSSRKSVCCQAISPLAKREQAISLTSRNVGQQSPSPDRWMEDCICDIVRNINEAPFLHMLFDSKDSSAAVTFQRQRVAESAHATVEDKWKDLKNSVSKASPDGVILVHHLDDEAMEGCCLRDGSFPGCMKSSNTDANVHKECGGGSDLWGVLVLGKSIARSACYILKTTSVVSSYGTCTQFCLTKAKCFGPSWHEQVYHVDPLMGVSNQLEMVHEQLQGLSQALM